MRCLSRASPPSLQVQRHHPSEGAATFDFSSALSKDIQVVFSLLQSGAKLREGAMHGCVRLMGPSSSPPHPQRGRPRLGPHQVDAGSGRSVLPTHQPPSLQQSLRGALLGLKPSPLRQAGTFLLALWPAATGDPGAR